MIISEDRDRIWNTCRHCGKIDGEEKGNWVINSCCRKCNNKIENENDFNEAQREGRISRDDSIMCPYCGNVQTDEVYEYANHKTYNCQECDKESDLEVEYTASYTRQITLNKNKIEKQIK